jgi:hypothetical protein
LAEPLVPLLIGALLSISENFRFFPISTFLSLSTSLSPLLTSAVLATSFPPLAFSFFAGGGFEVDLLRLTFFSS